ncbi:MAG: BACON domain-containing protein [Draconibacterium sp.]
MKQFFNEYPVISRAKSLKSIRLITFVTLAALLLVACDFNYPEERLEDTYSTDLEYHFDVGASDVALAFQITEMGNSAYQVIVYPQWAEVTTPEGKLQNGNGFVPLRFINPEGFMQNGRAEGYIYIRIGDQGIFRFLISYGEKNTENPNVNGEEYMTVSTAAIDFAYDERSSFTIENPGEVGKNWFIQNIPSWLELSHTSGYLAPGESLTIECMVNREGLTPGSYSQIINIESDRPQLSAGILMEMLIEDPGDPVNSASLKWISGTVKDAYYCKVTDYLYILTASPNALLVKTPGVDSLVTYPLERIPNCIDITADGKTMAIGYNQALVDLRDAATYEQIKLYETDCVPFDLVFGENDWCYLSPDDDQWVSLYSLNLTNGVTFRTQSAQFYEKSILRKMPGKPLIYITRPQLTPGGIQIVNIEGGIPNDTVPGWHEETGSNIWLSLDGSKIIAGDKDVHNTPEYTTETSHLDLPRSGKFEVPRNYITSLDYNTALKCYFVSCSDYYWGTENADNIYQVNEVSYSAEKSLKVGYYPGYVGTHYNPGMAVHHVFSNSEGTRLFALKNVKRELEMNVWALEIFDLPLE